MSMLVSFVLSFFPRDVLDEILNLIGSVSEGFPSYSFAFVFQSFNYFRKKQNGKVNPDLFKPFYLENEIRQCFNFFAVLLLKDYLE